MEDIGFLHPSSFSNMDWIAELTRREFQLRPKLPTPPDQSPYHLHKGSIPVLLSASHSTYHMRNGKWKFSEAFSAGFAQLVAEQTGAFAFYPRFAQADDPNFSAESPYKDALKQIIQQHNIRFVLDIHGCLNRHGIGLALGTINGRSCPMVEPTLNAVLIEQGWQRLQPVEVAQLNKLHPYHFVINLPKFAGGVRQHTVTRFVSETLGVEAAQLEICSTMRVPIERWKNNQFEGDKQGIARTLQMLVVAIRKIPYAVRQPPVVAAPRPHANY